MGVWGRAPRSLGGEVGVKGQMEVCCLGRTMQEGMAPTGYRIGDILIACPRAWRCGSPIVRAPAEV